MLIMWLCGLSTCILYSVTSWSLSIDFLFLLFQNCSVKGRNYQWPEQWDRSKRKFYSFTFSPVRHECLLRAGSHLPFLSPLISPFLLLSASFPTMFLSLAYLTQGVNNFLLLLALGYFVILCCFPLTQHAYFE